ncbi:MAG: metallophosphoesterase [Gammaproteobacteria bacterium]|nr:metallophosphoesterase [Gammaproteobacteria bacterium]
MNVVTLSAMLLATASLATVASADDRERSGAESLKPFTIAVIGDWPYSQNLLNNAPRLINSVNADPKVRLLIHVGDLHSGSMPCTSADILPPIVKSNPGWNQWVYSRLQQIKRPVVYTPGDNEWADCHKGKQLASGAPLKELASVRRLFFAKPGATLGVNDQEVSTQAKKFNPLYPADAQFVENVMWEQAGVVFVTLNVPGGSNDDKSSWGPVASGNGTLEIYGNAQAAEQAARKGANLRWLERAFDKARDEHAKGVVIALQADLWDPEALPQNGGQGLDGYTAFVQRLADLSTQFGRPVLLLNGDTHAFRDERPLADPASATGLIHHTQAVPNLRRVVVQGALNMPAEWLRLTIDPRSPEVFGAIQAADHVVYCTADDADCDASTP